MLEFRYIELSDKEKIQRALTVSDFMGCEYTFANNLAWRRLANSKIAFYKDFYICGAFGNESGCPSFILPAGSGSYSEVISELKRFCGDNGHPLVLTGVTESSLEMLNELFPDSFTAAEDRDSSDYIYLRSDLADLPGKKYHAKRNHLAWFNELETQFSLITENDIEDCIVFCTDTYNSKGSSVHSAIAEQFALNTYFSNFRELGLSGAIIRSGSRIVALTIGERLNSDTFCVHIEKADTSYAGIYAGINNLFVRNCVNGFKYVNREEDLGIEGLRKAKLSYHPAFILRKYTVTFK